MKITEPMTMVTDYALGVMTVTLGALLFRAAQAKGQLGAQLLAASFVATALAAFTGGTFHGFTRLLSPAAATVLWKVTVYSTGIASFFFLTAVTQASLLGALRTWLLVAAGVKLAAYLVWMTSHDDFRYVVYDYVPAMVAAAMIEAPAALAGVQGARWIVAGILVSFVAAAVQRSGIRLHAHFNHNDLFHLVQMAACWLLYRGGLAVAGRS